RPPPSSRAVPRRHPPGPPSDGSSPPPSGHGPCGRLLPLHVAIASNPVRLAQLALENLAVRVLRQLRKELHRRRLLVRREPQAAVLDDVCLRSLRRRPEDHQGLDGLAPLLVRYTDDSHLLDGWVRADDLLDLARVDVGAAGDDHVFLAVSDVQVSVLVQVPDVPGMEPAVPERL